MNTTEYRAVIFDIGGVVVESPLHAIAVYEQDEGLPEGFVNGVVTRGGSDGAWARLERGELHPEEFYQLQELRAWAAERAVMAH